MESFNLSDHKAVACPYCETSYCRTCIQTCLLQDTVAQCQEPACRKTWTDEFLRGTMTKVFMNGPYKAHREKILIDQERARLPETQEDAMRYRTSREIAEPIQAQLKVLDEAVKALPAYKAYHDAVETYRNSYLRPNVRKMTKTERETYYDGLVIEKNLQKKALDKASKPMKRQIKALRSEAFIVARDLVGSFGKIPDGTRMATAQPKSTWTFIMRCPTTACEGFVGLDWKCGMCTQQVCKECRECTEGSGRPHACDPDKVASVKALAKEAKPCPKCAAMISKIDGCDQMWCTQCHTAFSWRTGTVETHIHNPHYYQWMRQTGQHLAPVPQAQQLGGAAPGAGGAAGAGACQPPTEVFRIIGWRQSKDKSLSEWIRVCQHVENVERMMWAHTVRTENTRHAEEKRVLRVKRLVKDIDDAAWGTKLQKLERDSNKARRILAIYDMFVMTAADMLRPLLGLPTGALTDLETLLANLTSLGAYADEELRKINREFNSSAAHLVSPKP
jgi:hypothetical protein